MVEQYYNSYVAVGAADTTLDGAIDGSVTSLVVLTLPATITSGQFRILNGTGTACFVPLGICIGPKAMALPERGQSFRAIDPVNVKNLNG